MKRFNHALTLSFTVASDDPEQPTVGEILFGLARRIASLKAASDAADQWIEATQDVYDTYEFDSEESYEQWLKEFKIPPSIMEIFSRPD